MADAPADLEIRLLRPGDDPDAQLDLSERAFGPGSGADRDRRVRSLSRLIAGGRYLGAFVGSNPAAAAAFQDMRQWWRGRPVPMAGVSSVKVAPEYRGRGIGRRLMTALLDEIAARGYPLSALFPATVPLYRSLGWELAGARDTAVIPARSLLRLIPPDAGVVPGHQDPSPPPVLRRAGPGDAAAVIAVLGRVHEAAGDCGPLTWDTDSAADWLDDPGLYAYLAEDGILAYRWHGGNEGLLRGASRGGLRPDRPGALDALGSHASIADTVYATTGPASAFWWLTRERDADIRHRSRWMLRVVDAPAAIAARGFPAATSLSVPLRIADDARPANSGRWQLSVAGGAGTLDPLGPDAPASTAGPDTPAPPARTAAPSRWARAGWPRCTPGPLSSHCGRRAWPPAGGRPTTRRWTPPLPPRPTCSTPFDGHAAGVAPLTARGPVSSRRTDVRGLRRREHLVGLSYARHPIRVLGVDPGLTRCGVGVVEGAPGRALTMVRVGVIRTPAGEDIAVRLLAIETEIEAWLDACRPDAVAVERVFSQQNVRTVMGTAQAGAIAIACAARRGLPVALHTPSEVKAAVTGNGRADKAQVTAMVTRLLRVSDPPRPADAADALALAICHIWRGGGAGLRLAALTGRGGSAS